MSDQPADNYIKSQKAMCTCCQLPFKFTKKWNPQILMQKAIKIYGEAVKFEEGVNICKKCWDGLEKPKEENTENAIDDFEPTDAELKEMMKELHISEEAETKDKILEDWSSITCVACLKEVDLMKAVFIDEAPYHKHCAEEELRYED